MRAMDERSERIAKWFEWPVLIAALAVIPVILIEQSNAKEPWDTIAAVGNWLIWLTFAVEFFTILAVVPRKRWWLRHHPLEVVIVFLTPPFMPSSLQAFRALRLLRVLRLARLAPLVRRMFSPDGLRWAAILALLTVVVGGAAFTSVEKGSNQNVSSTWDGIWWCFSAMTTVGSEIQPTTTGGRIIAMLVVAVGLSFIAFLTGAIARRFIEPAFEEVEVEVEEAEHDVLNRIRAIAAQLDEVEEALERRSRSR